MFPSTTTLSHNVHLGPLNLGVDLSMDLTSLFPGWATQEAADKTPYHQTNKTKQTKQTNQTKQTIAKQTNKDKQTIAKQTKKSKHRPLRLIVAQLPKPQVEELQKKIRELEERLRFEEKETSLLALEYEADQIAWNELTKRHNDMHESQLRSERKMQRDSRERRAEMEQHIRFLQSQVTSTAGQGVANLLALTQSMNQQLVALHEQGAEERARWMALHEQGMKQHAETQQNCDSVMEQLKNMCIY
jgi:hypothetical protein